MDLILTGDRQLRERAECESLLAEALAAAPEAYDGTPLQLLPRYPSSGRCRLCGETQLLTKEHIPPKSAGNVASRPELGLSHWLERQDLDAIDGGHVRQGGIWGYTLCRECNSFTGREYGTEYKAWAIRAMNLLSQDKDLHPSALDQKLQPVVVEGRFGGDRDGGVSPGAMVRQVLSGMCSLSSNWDIAGEDRAIRRIVLDKAQEPLPSGMSLGMELYVGPTSRMVGPQIISDSPGHWAWVMEIAHPPFEFMMVLASNYDASFGLNIGCYTKEDTSRRVTFDGSWQIGFGWTPLPGDLRSRAAIQQETEHPSGAAITTDGKS